MKRKHKRLTFVIVALALLGTAVGLVLFAFKENIVFFHSPTEVNADSFRTDRRFRLGGLVEEGSVVKEQGTVLVTFRITDLADHLKFEVNYTPLSWQKRYNLVKGATHGLGHTLTQLGYMRPHNRHADSHHLYFVGASTHPGTGVQPALVSARLTATTLLADALN